MQIFVEIRAYRPTDTAACAAVFAQAWHAGHPALPREIDQAVFEAETAGENVLVAEVRGRIAGFVAVDGAADFVHHLYVHPDHQRAGIGRALLQAARRQHSGRLSLKCLLSNDGALTFYRREGWIEGERGLSDQGPWVRMIAPPR